MFINGKVSGNDERRVYDIIIIILTTVRIQIHEYK